MNQKEEEKLVMQYFRDFYPEFPKGKLSQSESPDFILKLGPKKSIGIELTTLDRNTDSLKVKIETTLENKDDKIGLYQRKQFNAIWLIIHVDFIDESRSFNIKNKLQNWSFISRFDRVYLIDLFERKIFPINV